MRAETDADIAILNSGTIRANSIFGSGIIKNKFISECFPMEEEIVKVKINGQLVLRALENGVSLYPKYDGRFPAISGLKFKFDPSKTEGARIITDSVILESGERIGKDKVYTLAIK